MLTFPEAPTRRALGAIHRRPLLTLALTVLSLVGVGLVLRFGPGIHITSRIQDLLPESAPSVQASELLEKRLGSADMLVVTLMSSDLERVKGILPQIALRLDALEEVHEVQWRQEVAMLERNAMIIFPSLPELDDYYRELTDAIRDAVKRQLKLFDDDEADPDGEPPEPERTFAWGEWEHDDGLSELGRTFRRKSGEYREFFYNRDYTTLGIKVFPSQGSGNIDFCRHILGLTERVVREVVEAELGPIGPEGVVTRIDLGGGYRNALEQVQSVQSDMVSSASTSFALLALVVILFFRSVRGFFAVILPLVVGLVWTVGFVSLTVGYLNLITAFIFAVLLGLGIDFGIHYYGRWREERAAGHDDFEAMVITTRTVGAASVLAGSTTSLAFLSLTLADFRGFSQFGGIASVGVLLSLLAVMILQPALLFAIERFSTLKLMGYTVARDAEGAIERRRFPLGLLTLGVGGVFAVGGYLMAPLISMELDFNQLGARTSAEQSEHQRIQYGTTQATAPAVIFTDSAEDARHIFQQLEDRAVEAEDPVIKSYQSLFSLVPSQQAEKRAQVLKICRKLARKVRIFEGDPRDGAEELLRHCEPQEFTAEDLPLWVKSKFSDRSGRLGEFIFVSPKGSISDGNVALKFREVMLTLRGLDGETPVVSGKPMIWADVILAMKTDGPLITGAALATVLLLLIVYERRALQVVMIAMPLLMGLGLTVGVMALWDIKLNFFNMLMLPTVIGMGVDDGVHLYHRYKELGRDSARYVVKTTGMAAVLTTLTTSIGFASLMTADHRGLESLGLLTVIGMVAALLTTLVFLPATMQWLDDRARQAEA